MNFQIFPNWFKKVGLTIFILFSILTAGDPIMDGLNLVAEGTHHYFRDLYGNKLYSVFYILPTLGLLLYFFSKEKTEDDFIRLLRLQSYQITVIIFLLVAVITYIVNPKVQLSLDLWLSLFIMLHLIIFSIKKKSVLDL